MRSLLILLALAAQTCVCCLVRAQPDVRTPSEQPGVILIEVSPTLDSALGAAFIAARPPSDPEFSHSEINLAVLSGDSTIRNLLGGLSGLHGLRLQPYIPTHSVAFEDIRERSNPELFQKASYSISNPGDSIHPSSPSAELRSSEQKIAHWFRLYYSDSMAGSRAALVVRKSRLIQNAEPVFIRQLQSIPVFTPNDPDISQQYSLSLMNCFEAWAVVRCDSTMILADDDVGTDWTHPDLAAAIYNNPGEIGIDAHGNPKQSNGIDDDSNGYIDDWHGWDFGGADGTAPDNNPIGTSAHGTHTAGIMGAVGNNGIGIAGVAFGAKILPIKTSIDNSGFLQFGFEGMVYAADMHAKLVSCSWGGSGRSEAEQDVIDYLYAKDCAVVVAAGNYGSDFPYQYFYPASYKHVLSVAMLDPGGNVDNGSYFNTQVDIAAPGNGVFSTMPDSSYATMDGTSMACPNAAGVVALVRQRFPKLTAEQAVQQVRVTGNPLLGLDSDRVYFEGHGEVDAYRAVTDTNTFSARIDTFSIADKNGTGSFSPGESGGITIRAMNFLKPLSNLKARIELVNTPYVDGANYVTLHDSIISFGAVGTLQTVSNDPSKLQLSIADSAPDGTPVLLRVIFYDSVAGYDSVGGYAGDYDYIRFTIEPSYLDLDTNNLTVTFSSTGTLGYNDIPTNSEGSGFVWTDPPAPVLLAAAGVLNYGGLMAGTDSNHLVDVVIGPDGATPDQDFTASQNIHYVVPPDHPYAAQELAFSLTDDSADSSVRIGLNASCRAYEFLQGLAANAIVIKYLFQGSPGGLLAESDNAAAALFLDWDIGASGLINVTRFDSASQTAISYRLEPGYYPYAGVKLLSPLPPGAALNYRAIWDDGAAGGIDPYTGLSKSDKWTMMTQFLNYAGPDDISHSFGLKNMPLRSQDSVEMTIVIALAASPELLHQTIDETAQLWAETSSVTPATPANPTLEVFPNPFQHALHIAWDGSGASPTMLPARVTIYDAIGRIVDERTVAGSEYDFTPPTVPSGFYIVDVEVGGTHLRRQVVAEE